MDSSTLTIYPLLSSAAAVAVLEDGPAALHAGRALPVQAVAAALVVSAAVHQRARDPRSSPRRCTSKVPAFISKALEKRLPSNQ